jgi:hypothetical protein
VRLKRDDSHHGMAVQQFWRFSESVFHFRLLPNNLPEPSKNGWQIEIRPWLKTTSIVNIFPEYNCPSHRGLSCLSFSTNDIAKECLCNQVCSFFGD